MSKSVFEDVEMPNDFSYETLAEAADQYKKNSDSRSFIAVKNGRIAYFSKNATSQRDITIIENWDEDMLCALLKKAMKEDKNTSIICDEEMQEQIDEILVKYIEYRERLLL
ncbi:MAG: hypothetical protein QW331_03685 [Candidatus Woesearchaeota archaeon]